ncbi:Protoglobin-domain-containing protein [Polychytrium aggregatum]|uniref:Protoglobin-domain-containing protein n=1 Tax=Polychytrium aggregatum TaxID=110093 RepID=UPI0022FDD5DF|nr:Protoglobin-domain-containing protein [Polychytrium aggregatum]KAI9208426.1 Protoglobin-domain-containing protein [Polychytrium aggregatum]
MPAIPSIKHIDRDRLYTDRLYRYQYICEVANFGEEDIKALKASASIVAPLVPAIVDAVYERLFSYKITKSVFTQKNEGFTGHMDDLDHLNLTSDTIKFRKDFLKRYLVKLVTAEYDAKFVTYLDWVGRIHTNTPLKKSKINVEYVHVGALFTWLHGFLVEALDPHPKLAKDPVLRGKILAAFSKLLWIQNDFFAKYYVLDGQDLLQSAPEAQARPEFMMSGSSGEL